MPTGHDQEPDYRRPDPRWSSFLIDQDGLAAAVAVCMVPDRIPPGVKRLLALSRDLIVHSWWQYDFLPAAVLYSGFAVEAALRHRLGELPGGSKRRRGPTLGDLIDEAQRRGLLADHPRKQLNAMRSLRNSFAHPDGLSSFTPGAAVPIVRECHSMVAALFPKTPIVE